MTILWAYVASALFFLVVDGIWLGFVATSFFKSNIGHLMADKVNFPVALVFYLIYVIGVVIFAVRPALLADDIKTALLYGALFGLFCYGTYDITNLATLRDWPIRVACVDIAWGTALTGLTAGFGYWVTKIITTS